MSPELHIKTELSMCARFGLLAALWPAFSIQIGLRRGPRRSHFFGSLHCQKYANRILTKKTREQWRSTWFYFISHIWTSFIFRPQLYFDETTVGRKASNISVTHEKVPDSIVLNFYSHNLNSIVLPVSPHFRKDNEEDGGGAGGESDIGPHFVSSQV